MTPQGRRFMALLGFGLLVTALTPAFASFADAGAGEGECRPAQTEPVLGATGLDDWDYGDAPDTTAAAYTTLYTAPGAPLGFFPTVSYTTNSLYGTPGARHQVGDVGWLGNIAPYGAATVSPLLPGDFPPTQEADADALPDGDVVVTNLDPATGTPDHDGRDDALYAATLPTFGFSTLDFRVSSTTGIQHWYVNILIDWNYDGVWFDVDPSSGAPEWAVVNMPVSVPAVSSVRFTTPAFPTGSTPGTPWLRITLSPEYVSPSLYGPPGWEGAVPPGVYDATGQPAFTCGETEDWCKQVSVVAGREDPTGGDGNETVLCVHEADCDDLQFVRICDGVDEEHDPDTTACARGSDAQITNLHAGSTNGYTGTYSATGNTGTFLPAGSVSGNGGIDVDIAYRCIDSMTLEAYKTWPTPSSGPLYSKTYGLGCATGTLTEKVPVGFDNGEYEFVLTWNGCDGNSGTDNEFAFVVDPPIL